MDLQKPDLAERLLKSRPGEGFNSILRHHSGRRRGPTATVREGQLVLTGRQIPGEKPVPGTHHQPAIQGRGVAKAENQAVFPSLGAFRPMGDGPVANPLSPQFWNLRGDLVQRGASGRPNAVELIQVDLEKPRLLGQGFFESDAGSVQKRPYSLGASSLDPFGVKPGIFFRQPSGQHHPVPFS